MGFIPGPGALCPLTSPQGHPLAIGKETEEGCSPGAGSPAAPACWAGAPPGLSELLTRPLYQPQHHPSEFPGGGQGVSGGGDGVGAEWRLSTPMSGDRGPRAHHGRHPWEGSSLLELVADPVFPPAPSSQGAQNAHCPGGRLGGQAHCTHKGGWTRVHSRLLWDRLAGGPGLWNTGHSLLWDCSCPAPGRAVGWTGPALGARALLGDRSSARGHVGGDGSRPGWGPPTPGTNRGAGSVNAE